MLNNVFKEFIYKNRPSWENAYENHKAVTENIM